MRRKNYFIQRAPYRALTLLLLMAFCLLHCENKARGSRSIIQVKGSDTIVNVAQAWAEAYKKVEPSVEIEVSGGGSGVGIAALTKGAIDIATASRNIKQEESEEVKRNTGKDPVEFVVGYDALAVFIHKDNPLDSITVGDLDRIYDENGDVKKWSQLGVVIPGSRHDEIVRVSRQSSSGTYEFFREIVLHKHDFRLGSCDMNGSKEVTELVSTTKTAIGYSGMGYVTPHVKMLKIKKSGNDPAYAPTVENTLSHSYPLGRSLHLYTPGAPEGAVKRFIDWVLSDAGQIIMQQCGFVPIRRITPANP